MRILEAPHDALFGAVFRHPANAASWLPTVLPPALSAAIDWRSLRPAPATAFGVHLRRHLADLVFTASLHGGGTVVFVIEHKFDGAPELEYQLLRYVVHLRRAFLRRGRGIAPLIVPVVLHHGATPLAPPASHPWLAALPPAAATELAAVQAKLAFFCDDLAAASREPCRRELTPFAQLGLLCLHSLPRRLPDQVLAAFDRWQSLLRAVDRGDEPSHGRDAIDTVGWYALAVSEVPAEDLSAAFARILRRPENTIMSTLEHTYLRGKAEGRVEGHAEARVETLLRLLTRRFGEPAADVVARTRAASIADLDRWTDRILEARTLDDVFAQ